GAAGGDPRPWPGVRRRGRAAGAATRTLAAAAVRGRPRAAPAPCAQGAGQVQDARMAAQPARAFAAMVSALALLRANRPARPRGRVRARVRRTARRVGAGRRAGARWRRRRQPLTKPMHSSSAPGSRTLRWLLWLAGTVS